MGVFLVGSISTIAGWVSLTRWLQKTFYLFWRHQTDFYFYYLHSCVRLYTIEIYTESTNPVYDAAPITLSSFIELDLGLACACALGLSPFIHIYRWVNNCWPFSTKPAALKKYIDAFSNRISQYFSRNRVDWISTRRFDPKISDLYQKYYSDQRRGAQCF